MSDQVKSGIGSKSILMVHPEVDENGHYHVDIVEYGFGRGEKSATIGGLLDLTGEYLGDAAFMFDRWARNNIHHRLGLLGYDSEQWSVIIEHLEGQVGLSIYLDNTD